MDVSHAIAFAQLRRAVCQRQLIEFLVKFWEKTHHLALIALIASVKRGRLYSVSVVS